MDLDKSKVIETTNIDQCVDHISREMDILVEELSKQLLGQEWNGYPEPHIFFMHDFDGDGDMGEQPEFIVDSFIRRQLAADDCGRSVYRISDPA